MMAGSPSERTSGAGAISALPRNGRKPTPLPAISTPATWARMPRRASSVDPAWRITTPAAGS